MNQAAHERLIELAIRKAAQVISAPEREELEALLRENPELQAKFDEHFEHALITREVIALALDAEAEPQDIPKSTKERLTKCIREKKTSSFFQRLCKWFWDYDAQLITRVKRILIFIACILCLSFAIFFLIKQLGTRSPQPHIALPPATLTVSSETALSGLNYFAHVKNNTEHTLHVTVRLYYLQTGWGERAEDQSAYLKAHSATDLKFRLWLTQTFLRMEIVETD